MNTHASCADATPYLNWDLAAAGAPVDSIVVHVLDSNGTEVLTLHDTYGSVLWPGWTRVDNRMTLTNPAVETLHIYADITVGQAASLERTALGRSRLMANGVVSTGRVTVSYPPASVECVGLPPTVTTPPTVSPTEVGAVGAPAVANATLQRLPETGFPSDTIALAGVVLILAGLVMVARARAERLATD